MTSRRTPVSLIAAMACCSAGVAAHARPDESGRMLMLDRQLRASLVTVASIGDSSVRMAGAEGDAAEIPLRDVVALAPAWWRPGADEARDASNGALGRPRPVSRSSRGSSTPKGMILLTDGRRLVGKLVEDDDADRVGWEHERLGRSFFLLDDVRRLTLNPFAPGVSVPPRNAEDRVLMTNGDVVEGFVESIGESVNIEAGGRNVVLAMNQVAVVELSNPAQAASGVRVWLTDGSVAGGKGFAPAAGSGEFRLISTTPADGAPHVGLSPLEVVGIVPDAARVVPLASLPVASETGVGDRLYTAPAALRWQGAALNASWRETVSLGEKTPPLDTPDIELPGPMIVEWVLPSGAARVAGWAEIPPEARVWAEFTLVFEGVSARGEATPLASESMSGTRPVVEFNIELAGAGAASRSEPERLRVSIQPGPRGPIQNRVVLRRTLLLVDDQPAR